MWQAVLDDGTTVSEAAGAVWGDVKGRVKLLGFAHKGLEVWLPGGQQEYMRANSASVPIHGGEAVVESRWIGFRTKSGKVFKLRFDEKTGNMSVEAE
jgi:hypothetical protein